MLLHGLGGSRTAWEPQLTSLAGAGYRAAAWDMPGYGASRPPDEWTFRALASACTEWIDVLGGPAHVVGLSMGGMIALHLALASPASVRSLVLCDTSPAFGFDGTTSAGEWIEARLAPIRSGATPETMATGVFDAIMAPESAATARLGARAAMARVDRSAFEGAVRCLPTHDVRDRLVEIAVPTLVVVGELDRETPPPYARHLADHIAGSTYVEIPGSGHISNLERPDEFDAALLAFLGTFDAGESAGG